MKQQVLVKKHLQNIEDLKNHQDDLRNTYQSIGQEITTDLFNPGNVAFSLGKEIFKRIKKRKHLNHDASLIKHTYTSHDIENPKKSKFKRILKNPWIQWQILYISLQLFKKILSKVRSKN